MAEELDGRIQEVERSLTTLESQLREQVARTQSGTRTVLVVGIILIAIVFTYLTILTARIKPYIEPKALAQVLQGTVGDRIPALKKALEAEAPAIVTSLRTKAVAEIPILSKLAEDKALSFVDDLSDKLSEGTDSLMAKMLQSHVKELKPLVAAAAKPGNAEEIRKEFTKDLEELIGWKLDGLFKDYDGAMDVVEHHLDNLMRPEKQLTADERLEKEMATSLLFFLNETLTVPAPASPAVMGK